MKMLNMDNLIENLQEVKDKAMLDYVRIDEGRGRSLIEVIDEIDDKMGDFNNGIIILDRFMVGLYKMKIYTQLEDYQQNILLKILTKYYLCEPIYHDGVMLYITIWEK